MYPGSRCRDCCDDEVLFLCTVTEIESHGLVPLQEIIEGASAGAEDLREVAVELLSQLANASRSTCLPERSSILVRAILR